MEFFQNSHKLINSSQSPQKQHNSLDIHQKRDKFRIQLRKQQMDKIKKHTRNCFRFKKSETQILLEINCIEVLQDLRKAKQLNKLAQIVHKIFIYATSTQAQHIFNMFDEEIVSRLIIIIHQNIYKPNKEPESQEQKQSNQLMDKIMKQSLWILTNFTSLNYIFHQFSEFIDLVSHLLNRNEKQIIELCLISLGNLCENSLHKQKIIGSGLILNQVLKKIDNLNQFKDEGIYFIMKLFDEIDLRIGKPAIYTFFNLLIAELCKSNIDNTQIKNIIQAVDDFLSEANMESHPTVLLNHNHEIYNIVNWLLLQKNSNTFEKQQKLVLNIVNRFYLMEFSDQKIDQQYEQIILKYLLQNYLFRIYDKYEYNNNKKIKQALYEIFENACATESLLYIIFDRNLLLQHFIMHLDVNIFDINALILGALCNLCILGEEYQIELLIRKNIIEILTNRLYMYEDNQLNFKILEALKVIFQIGRYNQQEKEQGGQNSYLKKFIYFDGIKKLEEISKHQNSKLSNAAIGILEQYYDQIQYSKNYQQ